MKTPCESCEKLVDGECTNNKGFRDCERYKCWFRMKWAEIGRLWRGL